MPSAGIVGSSAEYPGASLGGLAQRLCVADTMRFHEKPHAFGDCGIADADGVVPQTFLVELRPGRAQCLTDNAHAARKPR